MVSYKEFAEVAKKKGLDQSQIDSGWGKLVNSNAKKEDRIIVNEDNKGENDYIGKDIYGDVGKKGIAGKNQAEGTVKTSTGLSIKPTEKKELGDLAQFGADAYNMESNRSGSLAERNDILANNLYLSGEDTEGYLNQFDSFKNASKEDRDNTIRAINDRIGEMRKKYDEDEGVDYNFDDEKAGYYRDADGNFIKIYGYQALSDDMKKYVDQMSDAEKKKISNMGAQALQDYIKYWADSNYEKDYREDLYDKAKDMRDIQVEQEAIQYGQQLRQAEEQVNNLMQNWEYLGNMGMPGLSKTKLQAVSDSIKEANTSLKELARLQELSKEASAKNWEIDVAQYEKQISDIVRDLNYKIPQEIQNALNKYTVAELEGNLDTMDGVVAFKKSLLDDLDNNISGMTSASLEQMNYITQSYMDMADKAYQEAKEYQQNANIVNTEMSSVKGYYVDGNGNAILDSNGLPISIPQSAPLDPVFDKESGKLIQFYYNDDGSIGATYTQVYDGDQSNIQASIVNALEWGASTQDILKYVPGATQDMVESLKKVVNQVYRADGLPINYGGKSYNVITEDKLKNGVEAYLKHYKGDGTEDGGQCGAFVNNYLKAIGVSADKIYGNYLEGHDSSDKKANMNSKEPVVGGIVIMDSPKCPENGHVAIVTAINDDGTIDVLESNWQGDEKVHKNTYSMDSDKIYGYFDPTKSIDDYNMEGGVNNEGTNGGNKGYMAIYDTAPSEKNNATQNTNYSFAVRMWEADELIRDLESDYKDRWSRNTLDILKMGERKDYELYQNEFITAVLRKESGAQISDKEFEREERKYFPLPGDSEETIKKKQKARETAIYTLMQQAGMAENGESWANFYVNNRKNYGSGVNNTNSNNNIEEKDEDEYDRP